MAKVEYWQTGDSIDYMNTSATDKIEANSVIAIGTSRCGIAGGDIPAGGTGALFVAGVFVLPHSTSGAAIKFGDACYWDATNAVVTATASGNTPLGWCTEACTATSETVKVKIG